MEVLEYKHKGNRQGRWSGKEINYGIIVASYLGNVFLGMYPSHEVLKGGSSRARGTSLEDFMRDPLTSWDALRNTWEVPLGREEPPLSLHGSEIEGRE